jgi:hypothetical protein
MTDLLEHHAYRLALAAFHRAWNVICDPDLGVHLNLGWTRIESDLGRDAPIAPLTPPLVDAL